MAQEQYEEKLSWIAIYEDGTRFDQYQETEMSSENIPREKLRKFCLIDDDNTWRTWTMTPSNIPRIRELTNLLQLEPPIAMTRPMKTAQEFNKDMQTAFVQLSESIARLRDLHMNYRVTIGPDGNIQAVIKEDPLMETPCPQNINENGKKDSKQVPSNK